ncbi:MAG: S9 family peptidase [Gemmatimonadetes bacterium]|nr:S9 family peptidase [Gemmatimonadota bacterium]
MPRSPARFALLLSLSLPCVTTLPHALIAQGAQGASRSGTKPFTLADYTKWRTIESAALSPDGAWVASVLRFANTLPADSKPVLRLRNLSTNAETEIAHATQPQFSPDGKWITYLVEPPPPARGAAARGDSAAAGGAPAATPGGNAPASGAPANGARAATPPRRWELRELATGRTQSWTEMQSATFSPTGTHLLLRRRPPTGGAGVAAGAGAGAGGAGPQGGGGGAGAASAVRATDVVLHELAGAKSLFLGSVGDAAFNRVGSMLAYTVDAATRDGNGLFVIDLRTTTTRVLDNDSLRYSRLTWNEAGTAVAVLKGRDVERMRERDNRLLVVGDVAGEPVTSLLETKALGFPSGFMISERAPLAFSDDGARVYLGIIPQSPLPDTTRRRSTDSIADVDIWRTQDDRVQSQQMIQAEADRNRTFRQAFVLGAAKFVSLSDSSLRDLEMPVTGPWAVGRDARAYTSDHLPPRADFYRVDLRTGERVKMLTGQFTGRFAPGMSPDGRTFLYFANGKWQALDLATNASRALGAGAPSFLDTEEDHPGPRPPYGVAGFTADGSAVVVHHRFDEWVLPLNGSAARNLTNGAGARDQVVYRVVRITPIDSLTQRAARVSREIDLAQPVVFSTYGEYTKKAGFTRLNGGTLTPLVWDDAIFSTPVRAAKADVVLLTRQTFREFPDLRVANGTLANARIVSDANPQQAEYLWGRRILFDYTTRRGDKLQGILAVPDDYQTGQKRPMLVSFYEKNSQNMHRYPMPSFITGMGAIPVDALSRGYITMIPDVQFHTGSSHSDMLDAVEAATKKVIAMGYADPKRIGVHGHSYGGEGAAFIGTRSKLFAAVGMGAGVTDLFTDFSQSWGWSYQVQGGSGANGNGYYMTGQGRWGFSPWEKPEVYRYESALTHVPSVSQPFLIMHGTADPTVSFTEGMNFYNALRFNGKEAVMLAYPGEGHGLRGLANRRDLTTRYFEFFDHYLKGTPAPKWMTDGVPFILKDRPTAPAPVIRP